MTNAEEKKANLNMNSWLINWALLTGHYHAENGLIETIKFGLFNQWFTSAVLILSSIKWFTLMFYPQEHPIAFYLGNFAYYFGPKLVVETIACNVPLDSFVIILLFMFFARNPKKYLFWVDLMKFDYDNQLFPKLNLNESDSQRFVRRFQMSWLIVKPSMYFYIAITHLVHLASYFYIEESYNLYHFVYYYISFAQNIYTIWFGMVMILYQVN